MVHQLQPAPSGTSLPGHQRPPSFVEGHHNSPIHLVTLPDVKNHALLFNPFPSLDPFGVLLHAQDAMSQVVLCKVVYVPGLHARNIPGAGLLAPSSLAFLHSVLFPICRTRSPRSGLFGYCRSIGCLHRRRPVLGIFPSGAFQREQCL